MEIHDKTREALKIKNDVMEEHGNWGEHPWFPVADWQAEVEGDYTRRGYWEWVDAKIEERNDEGWEEKE